MYLGFDDLVVLLSTIILYGLICTHHQQLWQKIKNKERILIELFCSKQKDKNDDSILCILNTARKTQTWSITLLNGRNLRVWEKWFLGDAVLQRGDRKLDVFVGDLDLGSCCLCKLSCFWEENGSLSSWNLWKTYGTELLNSYLMSSW